VLLVALPLGYYGDRLPAFASSLLAALLAGAFSLLTASPAACSCLPLVRMATASAGSSTIRSIRRCSPTTTPADRPGVYAIHRNAERAALVSVRSGRPRRGAGELAARVHGPHVPIAIVRSLSIRLREPVRGETDDPSRPTPASQEPPLAFGEHAEPSFAVPTLRRQFSAFFFIAPGSSR